jgi:endonuclease YncB( thermonuclease family)
MRGWWDGVLAAAIAAEFTAICACSGAMAQVQARTASACSGETIARGSASRIVDGRGFVMDDGREVRLAAIEVPPLPLPQESGAAPGGVAAKDALAALLAGSGIMLKQAEQQISDRYGRVAAYAFTVRDGVEHLAQADLVAAGVPRVAARAGSRACVVELLTRENAARQPSLAFGPTRIMTCSAPAAPPMCWPNKAILRWSRAKWCRCVKAAPPYT